MTLLRNTGKSILPLGLNPTTANSEGFINQAQALGVVKVFTPSSWNGFSASPTGDLYYINLGSLAVIWVNANVTGTSNANFMSFLGLPAEICPSGTRRVMFAGVINNGGIGTELMAQIQLTTSGTVSFATLSTAGAPHIIADYTGFTAASSKGLALGSFIIYPL